MTIFDKDWHVLKSFYKFWQDYFLKTRKQNIEVLTFKTWRRRRKKVTARACRTGLEAKNCQSWRFEKNSAAGPESNHLLAACVQLPYSGIILKVWQLVTLQPVDLQRPTVPLFKYLSKPVLYTYYQFKGLRGFLI